MPQVAPIVESAAPPKFDTNTGERIWPKFDVVTGEPIVPKFDTNTGERIQ